jgi:hypothetical protein
MGPGPDRVPAGRDSGAVHAGGASRRYSDRGSPGADGRAPVAVRAAKEWRGARGTRACVGRPEKKSWWPSPDEQYGFGFI